MSLSTLARLLSWALFAAILFAACAAPIPTPAPTVVPPTLTPLPSPTVAPTNSPTQSPTASPTDTATAAPTPTNTLLPDTTVMFSDDFGSPCLLGEGDDRVSTDKCEKGEYTIFLKLVGVAQTKFYGWVGYTDEVVEVDAHAISGPPYVLYGILFRVSADRNHYYLVALNRNGRYSAYRWDNPTWTTLIPPTLSEANNSDTAMNHLKVVVQGKQFAVFDNDQWLNTVTDSALAQGSVGLYASNQVPNSKVGFSNLRVSRINNPLVLPVGVPVAQPTSQPAVPTSAPTLAPTVPSKYPLPPGKGGLVVRNYYGRDMTFTINGQQYTVPANNEQFVVLDRAPIRGLPSSPARVRLTGR